MIFTCSIDDGHPSDLKAAALLDKHGLQATFYVPVRNREGPPVMNAQQLRELATRFEIGSHTLDHCYLRDVHMLQARRQIREGKRRLEDMLGRPVMGFCYPGGKYRRQHIALVKEAGFRYARTTMNLCFDVGTGLFEMPTTIQFYPHGRSVYLRNFVRGGSYAKRAAGVRIALGQGDWIARLHALADHALERNGVFHLWAHSKDIDDLDAWHHFDRFLAHVSTRVGAAQRLDNHTLALGIPQPSPCDEHDQCELSSPVVK
jgi:peptidoglycan/xylan/chitin deacetylase (PgdA/CDA1 family)